jgi:hypothetical protein
VIDLVVVFIDVIAEWIYRFWRWLRRATKDGMENEEWERGNRRTPS